MEGRKTWQSFVVHEQFKNYLNAHNQDRFRSTVPAERLKTSFLFCYVCLSFICERLCHCTFLKQKPTTPPTVRGLGMAQGLTQHRFHVKKYFGQIKSK